MHKVEYTPEELAWAKTIIKPELPVYDEKDHEIAKLRFILHEFFEEMSSIWFNASEWAQKNSDRSYKSVDEVYAAMSEALFSPDGGINIPDGTEQDVIDAYAENKGWDWSRSQHLEGHHCGDCTAVAASCTKCHAEQFYGFETPFVGKHKGSRALSIYMSAMDETSS